MKSSAPDARVEDRVAHVGHEIPEENPGRGHEHRGAADVDLREELHHLVRETVIEVSGGLVGDEELGVVHEGPCERHALRNALLPVVTSLGLSFGGLFGGAIVTEAIFAWPGMGRLAYESITGFDVPVIMGTVLVASTGILLGNLVADMGYAILDPRIRRA